MKKALSYTAAIIFTLLVNEFAYSLEYFRSIAIGNWESNLTWEMSNNNSTWFAATHGPDSTSTLIIIRSSHTVTVTSDQTVSHLVVKAGGNLILNCNLTLQTDSPYLAMESGSTISGTGIFRTASPSVKLTVRILSAPFEVISGTTWRTNGNSISNIKYHGLIFSAEK